ncbi:MAG: hypothetical protein ACK5MV_07410 [Aminipila sp.]
MFISDRRLLVVGIDHGFSMMKTPHATFENGVEKLGGEATLTNNTLIYQGSYYKVGEGRLPLMQTKTENENYFLLTLAAIAKEMDIYQQQSADVIHTRNYVPVESESTSIPEALIQCMEGIKSNVYQNCNRRVSEDMIHQMILEKDVNIPTDCKVIIREGLADFAKGMEAKLAELGFDLEMFTVIYAGGGATLMKNYGTLKSANIHYLEDIRANAKGYEFLAKQKGKFYKKSIKMVFFKNGRWCDGRKK